MHRKALLISLGCLETPILKILNVHADTTEGAGRSIMGGGAIFIYSCSAQLISFDIVN